VLAAPSVGVAVLCIQTKSEHLPHIYAGSAPTPYVIHSVYCKYRHGERIDGAACRRRRSVHQHIHSQTTYHICICTTRISLCVQRMLCIWYIMNLYKASCWRRRVSASPFCAYIHTQSEHLPHVYAGSAYMYTCIRRSYGIHSVYCEYKKGDLINGGAACRRRRSVHACIHGQNTNHIYI